ncbi:hypothetical protein BU23DRAFT_601318 [Bimuria novae-zelandiae CBS 107.79]|uniref:ABM domain-containing protein n=1 Tax=Bimuria novae-zelandiae CBS 107.79 TaxID=1447943 RepID=A0A6A5V4H6_9PLEO|nr:hypothetical protein BU23DRAFT_601318 [Bimuria novae-zelandiae CBS 107.79]
MPDTIDLVAILTPKAGNADRVEELLKNIAETVKEKEPGVLRYHLQRETQGDAPVLIMFETYKDKATLQAHGSTDHFKELGKVLEGESLLAEPMKIIFTKAVGGYASRL